MKATLLLKIHEYGNTTEKLAKEIANEIKRDCSTYGEVDDYLNKMKKELTFNDYGNVKYGHIMKAVEEMFEKEKNEMLLANRSNND